MYKFGLIGYPLSHSLSKVIQTEAFNSTGLDGTYDILETESEDLIDRIKFLKTRSYNGFNVTIPHKIPISLFLSEVDETANRVGSVNTVVIKEDKSLVGYNTDVYGFVKPIDEINLYGTKAIVLGTGGASRAVICGLFNKGVSEIDLYSRDLTGSEVSIKGIKAKFPELKINTLEYKDLKTLADASILVNTTPIGMKNYKQNESIITDDMMQTLDNQAIVYDIVYNPIETELIKKAVKFNKKYRAGLDMLIYQGAKAFEIWTGKTPDVQKMKTEALKNLI